MADTQDVPTAVARPWTGALELHVVGVNIHSVSREELARLSLHGDAAAPLFEATTREMPGTELAVLSTCNRVEFYLAIPAGIGIHAWLSLLTRVTPSWSPSVIASAFVGEGESAVTHLVRVACGLESDILGDPQVVAQVRRARSTASGHRTLGPTLDHLFSVAVRASRRARSDTAITAEDIGIGSIVADVIDARTRSAGLTRPVVCIVGAGAAAEAVADALALRQQARITVVARNERAASRIAGCHGGGASPWSSLETALKASDVIVAATAASQPVITHELVQGLVGGGARSCPVLIDLGHRPNIATVPGAPVIDLAQLTGCEGPVSAARAAAVPEVEDIVAAEVEAWRRHQRHDQVDVLIGALYRDMDAACVELGAILGDLGHADVSEHAIRGMRKVLHGHVKRLRSLEATGPDGMVPTDRYQGSDCLHGRQRQAVIVPIASRRFAATASTAAPSGVGSMAGFDGRWSS